MEIIPRGRKKFVCLIKDNVALHTIIQTFDSKEKAVQWGRRTLSALKDGTIEWAEIRKDIL